MVISKKTKQQKHLKGYRFRKTRIWLDTHKKFMQIFLISVAAIFSVIVIVGFIPYSFSAMSKRVERICETTFDGKCSIKKMTLVPWLGFSVEEMTIVKKENATTMQIFIPKISISYHFLPLLFKYIIVKDIAFVNPRIKLSIPVKQPEQKEGREISVQDIQGMLANIPFTVAIRAVSINNGTLLVEQKGESIVSSDGIDATLKIGLKKQLTLKGKIFSKQIRIGKLWNVFNFTANGSFENFIISLQRCRGDFYGGVVSASGKIDYAAQLLQSFKMDVSHVNLRQLYEAARINQGMCEGWLNAKVELAGSAMQADSIKGRGNVTLSDVILTNSPLQKNLLVFIAVPQIKEISFSKISSEIDIHDGKVFTSDLRGEGIPIDIAAKGWVSFDGNLSQTMDGVFDKDFIQNLPPIVERSLDDAEDGKKSFKCSVTGTFKYPRVTVDTRIVNRAVNNVFDELSKGLGKLFR